MAMLLLADVCFVNRSRLRSIRHVSKQLDKTLDKSLACSGEDFRDTTGDCRDTIGDCRDTIGDCRDIIGDCRDPTMATVTDDSGAGDSVIKESLVENRSVIPQQSSTPVASAPMNQNIDQVVIQMLRPKVTCPTLKLDDLLTFNMGWTVKSFNSLIEIGRGSFGRVLLARHRHTGTPLAIKQPFWSDDFASPGEMVQELKDTRARTTKEAMIQELLSGSSYFPKFRGTMDLGNELCQAVEFVGCKRTGTGFPLIEPPQLSVRNILKISEDVIKGMIEFHNHGLLHNDLKNDNVLLEKRGKRYHAVIIDFGMVSSITAPAKLNGVTRELKLAYMYGGEAGYIAPEIVLQEQPTSVASDVFSVGRLLVDIAHISGDLRSPWIRQISNIGMRCMAVNPDSRPTLPDILSQVTEVKKKQTPKWRRALRWISKKLRTNRK